MAEEEERAEVALTLLSEPVLSQNARHLQNMGYWTDRCHGTTRD